MPRCDRRSPVFLRVYDISNGKAATWSQLVLGKKIDGVWHTGVLVFGLEYFYSGGVGRMLPSDAETAFDIEIVEELLLGFTMKSRMDFERFLASSQDKFTPNTYDLIEWNCNHFSDFCSQFLLNGRGIPEHILELPETVASSFVGNLVLKVFKRLHHGSNPVDPIHGKTNSGLKSFCAETRRKSSLTQLEEAVSSDSEESLFALCDRRKNRHFLSTRGRQQTMWDLCKLEHQSSSNELSGQHNRLASNRSAAGQPKTAKKLMHHSRSLDLYGNDNCSIPPPNISSNCQSPNSRSSSRLRFVPKSDFGSLRPRPHVKTNSSGGSVLVFNPLPQQRKFREQFLKRTVTSHNLPPTVLLVDGKAAPVPLFLFNPNVNRKNNDRDKLVHSSSWPNAEGDSGPLESSLDSAAKARKVMRAANGSPRQQHYSNHRDASHLNRSQRMFSKLPSTSEPLVGELKNARVVPNLSKRQMAFRKNLSEALDNRNATLNYASRLERVSQTPPRGILVDCHLAAEDLRHVKRQIPISENPSSDHSFSTSAESASSRTPTYCRAASLLPVCLPEMSLATSDSFSLRTMSSLPDLSVPQCPRTLSTIPLLSNIRISPSRGTSVDQ